MQSAAGRAVPPEFWAAVRVTGAPTHNVPPAKGVAAELRRQISVLEILAGHGPGGLRRALEVSTEGRRVLRAVVSRRARGRG